MAQATVSRSRKPTAASDADPDAGCPMSNGFLNTAALNMKLCQTDLPLGFRFYTDADIDAIIDAVRPIELPGKRIVIHRSNDAGLELIEATVARGTALSERLEVAAHSYYVEEQEQAHPARSKIAKRLASIARNAEALHHALSLPENGDPSGVQQVLTKIAIVARREAAEGNGAGSGDEALMAQ